MSRPHEVCRVKQLISSTLALLFLLGFAPRPAEAMPQGQVAAAMQFTDIHGQAASTTDYAERVQIWTVGDYGSSRRLMDWMEPAGVSAVIEHPELRFSFLNFADVTAVPSLFRGLSLEILRHIDGNAKEKLQQAYAERGVELSPDRALFHLTPDWNGDYLALFGIPNAKKYHCWIIHDGRIIEHLEEGTPDISVRFAAAITNLDKADAPPAKP